MTAEGGDYELTIRPTRGWLNLRPGELWRYRDLFLLLVRREFIAKYKQTVLGPAWFVLQPLLMTVVFVAVFTGIAKIPTDGLPPTLFYLAGLLGWNYVAQSFQNSAGTLIANAHMFGKVYFPRLVVPLAALASNLFAFLLQAATFAGFWIFFKLSMPDGSGFGLSGSIVWLPLLLLQLAALSLGAGLLVASLTTRYRDLNFLVPFIVQLWMYATPVIYPLSAVPDGWRWLAVLNPATVPVEGLRQMLLGAGSLQMADVAVSAVLAALVLLAGLAAFGRVERTFIDTV